MSKLLSGRYIMTLTACVVFGYMSCKNMLTVEFIDDIIKMVVIFYFTKKD